MRIARKLSLLALAAIAAMAMAAPAANATPIEVVNESLAQHCTFATCSFHGVSNGNVQLEGYFFGFHVVEATCMNEYTVQFDEMGGGRVTAFRIFSGTGSDSNCDTLVTTSGLPWTTTSTGGQECTEYEAGEIHCKLGNVSITNAETGTCAGAIEFTIHELGAEIPDDDGDPLTNEEYHALFNAARIGTSNCYIDGEYKIESHAVHVNHL